MAQYRRDRHEYLANGNTIFEVVMLADQDGNPINTFGPASNIPIANGNVQGYSTVHKFGRSPALPNGSEATIWDVGNTYPWDAWSAGANNVFLRSSNTDNTTVFIQGLDANSELQSETITINGTGGVQSNNTYTRLFRMYNSGANSISGNVTAHYASNTGTTVAQITGSFNQTLMAVYTIPSGKTGFLSKAQGSSPKNAELDFRLYFRNSGGVFRAQHTGAAYGGVYSYDWSVPLVLPAGTDIDFRGQASTGGITASAQFDLILVDTG